MMKSSFTRGSKTQKIWLGIFKCNITRGLHIEIITELTAASFIAALQRFCARRNKPNHIQSDNGTAFIAANRILREDVEDLAKFFQETENQRDIIEYCSNLRIRFTFSPPRTSHWSGNIEAAVKQVKIQLYKMTDERVLNFEEMLTLLTSRRV